MALRNIALQGLACPQLPKADLGKAVWMLTIVSQRETLAETLQGTPGFQGLANSFTLPIALLYAPARHTGTKLACRAPHCARDSRDSLSFTVHVIHVIHVIHCHARNPEMTTTVWNLDMNTLSQYILLRALYCFLHCCIFA